MREAFIFWKQDWVHRVGLLPLVAILFLPILFGSRGLVQMGDEIRIVLSAIAATLVIALLTVAVRCVQMPEILRRRKIERATKCRVLMGTGTALAGIESIDMYQGGPETWKDHYECWIADVGSVLSVKQKLRFMSAIPDRCWHNGFWLQVGDTKDDTYQNMWKDLRGKLVVLAEIEREVRQDAATQATSSLYSTFSAVKSSFIASLKMYGFSR